jgi:hypothetical protein
MRKEVFGNGPARQAAFFWSFVTSAMGGRCSETGRELQNRDASGLDESAPRLSDGAGDEEKLGI